MKDKKVEERYKTRSKNSSERGYTSQRKDESQLRHSSKSTSQRQHIPDYRDRIYEQRTRMQRKSRRGCLVSFGLLVVVLAALYIIIFHSPLFDKKENNNLNNESASPSFSQPIESTPTPTAKLSSTDVPSPTPEPMSTIGYISTDEENGIVNMRAEPDRNSDILGELHNRETLFLLKKEGDYYKINYRGDIAYVSSKYVVEGIPEDNMYCNVVTYEIGYSKLIDITTIVPDIMIEMPYATSSNHVDKQMYPFELALLQETTALKLKKAQEMFLEDGYSLVIWDAYRPYSVTVQTYAIIQNPKLAADPDTGSKHNRGAAIDVTLFDIEKNEYVNMPTEVREMDYDLAKRSSSSMTEEQRQNMEYMEDVLGKAGFSPYAGEWWHYNDMMVADYPVLDIVFEAWVGR